MHHPPHRSRSLPAPPGTATLILGLACLVGAGVVRAGEVPPELVGRFTRGVQPLLLNRCGAGACHGGPTANEPRFRRPDVHGTIDRGSTLANLDTFLTLIGPDRDPRPLVDLVAVQHPREPANRRLVMKPLTPAERVVLESWIRSLPPAGQEVVRVGHESPADEPAAPPQRPNRFRVLLDTGMPPPAPRIAEPTGRTDYVPVFDKRKAAVEIRPESVPPGQPRGTDDSLQARPGAPASPPPTSRGSR